MSDFELKSTRAPAFDRWEEFAAYVRPAAMAAAAGLSAAARATGRTIVRLVQAGRVRLAGGRMGRLAAAGAGRLLALASGVERRLVPEFWIALALAGTFAAALAFGYHLGQAGGP